MNSGRYQEDYPRTLENRLTISENKDGKLDFKAFKAAEALNGKLSNQPGYIGLSQFGSRTRGSAKQDSDVDVVVFVDLISDDLGAGWKANKFEEIVRKEAENVSKDIPDTPVRLEFVYITPNDNLADGFSGYFFSQTVLGPQIEKYREYFSKKISALSSDTQKEMVENIAKTIRLRETAGSPKAEEMISSYGNLDIDARVDILKNRQRLWEEQIRQALRLTK